MRTLVHFGTADSEWAVPIERVQEVRLPFGITPLPVPKRDGGGEGGGGSGSLGSGGGGVLLRSAGRTPRIPVRVPPPRPEEGRAEQGGVDAGIDDPHPVHPGAAGGKDGDIVPAPGEAPGEVDQEGLHAAELRLAEWGDQRGDEGDAHAIGGH
jgi:hypothetical protein